MKKREFFLAVPVVACTVAFGGYLLATRAAADHTPPVITVPETIIQTSVQAEPENLLHGVTAVDDQDGDVSDKVIIEKISGIFDRNKTTITYAAFDQSGNVSKAQRTREFTAYEPPKFTLNAPLIFRAGSDFNVFAPVGAIDGVDGSLGRKVKGTLVSEGESLEKPGIYRIEFRVTNSLGDTVHLTLPIEVNARGRSESDPKLTTYLVYRKVNTPFDPMAYVAAESKERPLTITSDVDMTKPGICTVNYVDQRGENYGKTRLFVVVEA